VRTDNGSFAATTAGEKVIAPDSSAGCAICDLLLAAWYFLGARSVFGLAGTPHKKLAEGLKLLVPDVG
jgi:hypothetical protein